MRDVSPDTMEDEGTASPGTHGLGPPVALPVWVVLGSLSGLALLGMLMLVALTEKQSVYTVASRALLYTAAAGAAGAGVIALLGTVCRPGRGPLPDGFVQAAAEACVLLPSIVVLQMKQSPWMLGFAALATAIFWRGVRPLVEVEAPGTTLQPAPADRLGALHGLPRERRSLARMVLFAVLVQASAIAALLGFFGWSSALFSVWLLAMMGRVRAMGTRHGADVEWGARGFAGITAAAVLLTLFLLLPPRQGGSGGMEEQLQRAKRNGAGGNSARSQNQDGYAGIILLPPPVKKTKILPPRPRTSVFAAGRFEPVVIPFDGAYWYFKAPARRPSARAHVAQGRATEVNVRSSDRYPLLMEAHQSLGAPIALDCCREIEVALTNADTRPGAIAIGVILTDTTVPAHPHQLLGMKTMVSSDLPEIPSGREPVQETIRFAVPRGLKQCDEITVVFVPSRERERSGAKVSVRSFTLLPR